MGFVELQNLRVKKALKVGSNKWINKRKQTNTHRHRQQYGGYRGQGGGDK